MSLIDDNEKIEDYANIRNKAKEIYDTFDKVFCPAIGQHIHFTSNGFNHLVYKNAKKERSERVQILRFDLLKKAKFIIENSTTFQEFEEEYEYRRVNRYGKYISVNLLVKYWGFVAIIDRFRVKVVVRQIGNSKVEFYSVIPAWFVKQYRDIKMGIRYIFRGFLDPFSVLRRYC